METLDLKIGGMHCGGCAKRVQSLLQKTQGVTQASVSHKTGMGEIAFRPQTTGEAQIIAIVEGAGFTAEKG